MTNTPSTSWLRMGTMVVGMSLSALALSYAQPAPLDVIGHPTFMSPHASPIVVSGGYVFVVNTPADTVDVIETSSHAIVTRVHVGIDPVGLAVRPDGKEVWVANHISDSVSVIDTDPARPTHLQVIATVQDFDPVTRATRFDEPVGVAFAGNEKAYVALSSENQIAVINVVTRQVDRTLAITAQDPRAIVVRGGLLYVIPFESNNQTQISGCLGQFFVDGEQCTFDAREHVVDNNNVLSLGIDVDIVKHPDVPDRDLYVFDTTTDNLVAASNTVGTLLYGLTVDSTGRVFVAQTDARNDANGRAGTRKDGLAELENRAFLNRITRVDCSATLNGLPSCEAPEFIDLEPLLPVDPAPGMALATPFAIQISDDDATLVVSAAGSDTLFTVDAASGTVLGRAQVDAVPRGIALESNGAGHPSRAWVLNAVSNTVSAVNLSDPARPVVVATIPLDDPTHPAVKRGRIAFNDANASTTGTFSCESCHPDGHTDQLLWVLDTPMCDVPGCTQIPPRTTMPIRGLRDSAPYHWDGIPGDPFGGNNTSNIRGSDAPNCNPEVPESCTRVVVDGGLATTMCRVGDCPTNDEGKAGALTGAERDDLATFLLSVPYPPSQRRSYTNVLSSAAADGFKVFHIDGEDRSDEGLGPNVCGNCHRMPFWVSTNTGGTGMDAPTWRGAYDRWLILPQGRANVVGLYPRQLRFGTPHERDMWVGAGGRDIDPAWNMVTEGSTGFSGSFARSVTLNQATESAALTRDLLDALEVSAREGGIVLQGEGIFIDGSTATPVALQLEGGTYVERDAGGDGDSESFTRAELMSLAASGLFVGTFTGRLGINVDVEHPQPTVWSLGPIHVQRGPQQFPTLSAGETTMVMSGRHVQEGAHLIVDGRRVSGVVRCQGGGLPNCVDEAIVVQLATVPAAPGMHFLQIQNQGGLFSNDFIFHTSAAASGVTVSAARQSVAPRTTVSGVGADEATREQRVAAGTPPLTELLGARVEANDGDVFIAVDGTQFQTNTVVTGLEVPTSLAFAPDGRLFVTERPGRVRVVVNGQLRPDPALTLDDVFAVGEAGLLGLALDPGFSQNGFVYLLYTRNRSDASPANRIVRYRDVGNTLAEPVVLLDDLPATASHGGGRLRFGPDGLLYAAMGDGGDTDDAQDLASSAGKILRLRRDGTTPSTNPFASPVYSVGHRNAQGFDWHPLTDTLWATEPGDGSLGHDEVNRIEVGANYGWPVIEGVQTMPGMRPPALLFLQPIAPSGASFYDGIAIAGFRNDLFIATLSGTHLHRVRFDPADPSRIIGTERLLDDRFGRLRDVVIGPDGGLYVATSNRDGHGTTAPGDDRIIRLMSVP